jgi:acyl-coenzyme A synthetase/AMP-(fatty) acid ligase
VRKYQGIVDCACVPMEDKILGQVPKIFIVVDNKETFQKKDLKKFLKGYIDDSKMPRKIEIIDEIPRTYNGKIQRAKLLDNMK